MMHHLYLALLSESNPRQHPALLAMLYSFCPAAAGWWMSGINPPQPEFNVVWSVLEDFSSGRTLQATLEQYGLLEELIFVVTGYLLRVHGYRLKMSGLKAPELLPQFRQVQIDPILLGQNIHAIDQHFGRNWQNVLEYARVWTFVVQDWTMAILDDRYADRSIQKHQLIISVPGTDGILSFPAWLWKFKVGCSNYQSIGCISNAGALDQTSFLMCMMAAYGADQSGWPSFYSLDPLTGEAKNCYRPVTSPEQMLDIVLKLDDLARTGPYLPMGALLRPRQCPSCPFHAHCFQLTGHVSEAVIQLMDQGAA